MMKDILPIGSVVQLKNGEVKLMIINRFPLFNKEGTIGYFDYSACIFPIGYVDESEEVKSYSEKCRNGK